jgi:hypothetical protein
MSHGKFAKRLFPFASLQVALTDLEVYYVASIGGH